jgi:hypothetical protein
MRSGEGGQEKAAKRPLQLALTNSRTFGEGQKRGCWFNSWAKRKVEEVWLPSCGGSLCVSHVTPSAVERKLTWARVPRSRHATVTMAPFFRYPSSMSHGGNRWPDRGIATVDGAPDFWCCIRDNRPKGVVLDKPTLFRSKPAGVSFHSCAGSSGCEFKRYR